MPLYISGPMSGLPENNYPAFNSAADHLRERGYTVINPAEIEVANKTWENFMRADIAALLPCDTIFMLKGWDSSRGAVLELAIAKALGMAVFYQ